MKQIYQGLKEKKPVEEVNVKKRKENLNIKKKLDVDILVVKKLGK